jgi:hypothetical protein
VYRADQAPRPRWSRTDHGRDEDSHDQAVAAPCHCSPTGRVASRSRRTLPETR